jgi:hypothetical protein
MAARDDDEVVNAAWIRTLHNDPNYRFSTWGTAPKVRHVKSVKRAESVAAQRRGGGGSGGDGGGGSGGGGGSVSGGGGAKRQLGETPTGASAVVSGMAFAVFSWGSCASNKGSCVTRRVV